MRKIGYTLAEVLITLAVIGIIAAVTAPLVNRYKPDVTKIKYLATLDMLSSVANRLANSSNIYPVISVGENYSFEEYPFAHTGEVRDSNTDEVVIAAGDNKLCRAFAVASGFTMNSNACSDEYMEAFDSNSISFKTQNGVDLLFTTYIGRDEEGKPIEYKTDVYADVDGVDKGNNCFQTDGCKQPDRFKFVITANGQVFVNDTRGAEFLKTRSSWRKTDNVVAMTLKELNTGISLHNFEVATITESLAGNEPL